MEIPIPDISALVTEDDQPLDNIYSERQQRLLTEPLHASWSGPPVLESAEPRSFVALANVGVYYALREPPLVPDVLVSLDVGIHPSFLREKRHRCYLCWEFGKAPDVVVEIVSNLEGHELRKRRGYARMHVPYYVIWDPRELLGPPALRICELRSGGRYEPVDQLDPELLGLVLRTWEGEYEGAYERWVRWHLPDGTLLPTGMERAEAEQQRADAEQQRAEAERQRAEAERQRAEAAERRVRELEALLQGAAAR